MAIKDAYAITGDDIRQGDEMLFVVKAVVGWIDGKGRPRYRLYRCRWEGDERDIPQGAQIDMGQRVDKALFPTLAAAGMRD